MKSNLYGNIINLIHLMDLIDHHHKTKKKKNLFSSFIYTLGGINLLPLIRSYLTYCHVFIPGGELCTFLHSSK